MAKKFKDYYDEEYVELISDKLETVIKSFDRKGFKNFLLPKLETLEFSARQELIAEGFSRFIYPGDDNAAPTSANYRKTIQAFGKILGPELEEDTGMFTHGWWLWPVGRYVQNNAANPENLKDNFELSLDFIAELTKRFTGEFAIRPLLKHKPKPTLKRIETWSKDDNVHLRRLASEAMRISLPWAEKLDVAITEFETYKNILSNLRHAPEKFVQKSVGNNLNDLMKVDPKKAKSLISEWQKGETSKPMEWIIKHGSRSLRVKK